MAAEQAEDTDGAAAAARRRDRLHSVRLLTGLAAAAACILLGGWRAQDLDVRADALDRMTRDIVQVQGEARQIALWLRAESAIPADLPRETLAPIAGAAMRAAERLRERHEAAVQAAWRVGLGGDLSQTAAENFQRPAHNMDMMVRGFLRGVDRVAEASGDRRAAARGELLELVEGALSSGADEAVRTLDEVHAELEYEARLSLMLGVVGAALGFAFSAMVHFRSLRPQLRAARAEAAAAEEALRDAATRMRGAQRDRARMLDLAVTGLKGANERMRAASGLLARTPLTETQNRVLAGLRTAIADQAERLEGQRLLSAHGDGRLRLANRRVQPGALCAEWLDEARRRAVEEGRTLIVEGAPDQEAAYRGDAVLVRKALDRLLDDALRRVGKGGVVRVSTRLERLEEGRAELRVTVEHDGAPPGPSEIAAARDPFTERPPSETALAKGGDPFGLPLALAICNASGGGLELDGGPDVGARLLARFRFGVEAPAEAAEPAPEEAVSWFDEELADDVLAAQTGDAPPVDLAPASGERRSGPARRRMDRMRDGAALRKVASGVDTPVDRRSG